jgi:hypothetical protein
MKWHLKKQDKVIGEKQKKLLSLIAPLLAIFVGNKDMLPLIACGRRRSKKW